MLIVAFQLCPIPFQRSSAALRAPLLISAFRPFSSCAFPLSFLLIPLCLCPAAVSLRERNLARKPYYGRMSIVLNPPAARLGLDHALLRARSRCHEVRNFAGPLSIKTVLAGSATWRTGGRAVMLTSGRYVAIQEGQPYDIEVDSTQTVETFCVFFAAGFAHSVRAAQHGDAISLELRDDSEPLPLIQTVEPISPRMELALTGLQHAQRSGRDATAHLADLVMLLMADSDALRARAERLAAGRPATRAELLRRVLRGRDFIESCFDQSLTLKMIATAATMSEYHFHRSFHQTFGLTPLEHLTRVRVDRAAQMLRTSDAAVQDVVVSVGFESVPTFTRLFRQRLGRTPAAFRAENRKIR